MGSGFSKMKKQAKLMEQQIETMKKELKTKQFEGSSGNGLVTLTLNGDRELTSLKIKPECVDPSDLEGLEDLIKAAHAVAFEKAAQESSSGLPSGLPFSF